MNRIDRLAAILIQLQTKRLVKAQEIAAKFAISLRTVYRDIHALEEAGVPVLGEAGTGYRLMDGYKLPPVMFSEEEASALLTASKLMQSLSDDLSAKHYNSALDKIRAVLRGNEKDHIAEIDAHIAVVTHPAFAGQKPADLYLPKILKAIATAIMLQIHYTGSQEGGVLPRTVEPIGIYYQGRHWYLIAFCHLRNDYRNFRTDKIEKLLFTDIKITQAHPPLQDFINRMTVRKKVQKVVLDVAPDIVKYLGEQKYYNGFVKEEVYGNHIRMTFLIESMQGFARWFMLFGDQACIVEPVALSDLVTTLATKVLKKVGADQMLLT